MRHLLVALMASLAIATPAMAITVNARVSGGPIAVYNGPGDSTGIVGRLEDGAEILVDYCQTVDRDVDRRRGDYRPFGRTEFCRIPDYGWVRRTYIVGQGLIHVTPPDFLGRGW